MSALPHARPRSVAPALRGLASAATHAVLTGVCVVGLAVLAWAAAAGPLGYKILIDHSDSMLPAIAAGDVLVTRMERPERAQVGDVITFQDPYRPGQLLTHRVVRRQVRPAGYQFVTRGDANTGVERWTVAEDGSVGRLVGRLPKAGRALAWMRAGNKSIVFVVVAALSLVFLLGRCVWRL